MEKIIYDINKGQRCYFRTSVEEPYSKVLIQITEACNMMCNHCFVSSTKKGRNITAKDILFKLLPYLKEWNTTKVTLTGGEPLLNKDIYEICKVLVSNEIDVGICTNGSLINEELLNKLFELGHIHFNISLDGFSEKSVSKFRGIENGFSKIKRNIELVSEKKMLKGILCTPNIYSSINEYIKLCEFAKNIKAKYVLFNPIAPLGRGSVNIDKCKVDDEFLENIYTNTRQLVDNDFSVCYIRFPTIKKHECGECIYDRLFYVYANGDVVKCPYVSFALQNHGHNNKVFNYVKLGNMYSSRKIKENDFSKSFLSGDECYAHKMLENLNNEVKI